MNLDFSLLSIPTEYEILRPVETGSTGWVFEVIKEGKVNERYAMKVLRPDLFDNDNFEDLVKLFQKEAQRMCNNKHDCLVTVHDHGSASYSLEDKKIDLPYIMMEWVEGLEFNSWFESLEGSGEVKFWKLYNVTIQLLRALSYLHTRPLEPLLHLDIKSSNVKVITDGDETKIKLMDFGVAQILEGERLTRGQKHSYLVSTYEINPEKVKQKIQKLIDHGATVFLLDRKEFSPSLDLHHLHSITAVRLKFANHHVTH